MVAKEYVDRGQQIRGEERTARDLRIPYSFPRRLSNYSLPDGRLSRRPGYRRHLTSGEQALAKVTGSVSGKKKDTTDGFRHDLFQTPLSYGLLRHHDDFQIDVDNDWSWGMSLILGEKESLVTNPFFRQAAIVKEFSITGHTVGNPHVITVGAHGIPSGGGSAYLGQITGVTGTAASLLNAVVVIQYHSATQLKVLVNTTALTASGGTIAISYLAGLPAVRKPGVYVFDQTVLANALTMNMGSTSSPADDVSFVLSDSYLFSSMPLTTLSIGFNETEIFLSMDTIERSGGSSGRYWKREIELSHSISYAEGDRYEIFVRFDADAGAGGHGQVTLSVSANMGASWSDYTYDIPANDQEFVGAYDQVNGQTQPINRDIVLLNEHTARASYSSTCRVAQERHGNQVHFHAYGATPDDISAPWALSPPRGTRLFNLRKWSEFVSSSLLSQLAARDFKLDGTESNLDGGWDLDDGVGLCLDASGNERHVTIHHGFPAYAVHDDLLHNLGLSVADGQHLIASFEESDDEFVSDAYLMLKNTFEYDPVDEDNGGSAFQNYQAKHNFTAMAQIRTPYSWQQELNTITGGTTLADTEGNESGRQAMDVLAYRIHDGRRVNQSGSPVLREDGSTNQYFRAYDMTVFTLEGTAANPTTDSSDSGPLKSNGGDNYRVPIFKCSLTPEGRVAFEAYKAQGNPGSLQSRLYRVVSNTVLDNNETYTVVVKQEANYSFNYFNQVLTTSGFTLYVYLQKLSDAGSTLTPDETHVESRANGASHKCRTTSIQHQPRYDIIVGASMVNDGWDHSISMPDTTNRTAGLGPWVVPQHFMSPYQDQPGFFTLGFFRLWTTGLTLGEIEKWMHTSIARDDYSPSLVANIEVEEITGTTQVNKCRYPYSFELGYKGWGVPQGHKNEVVSAVNYPHVKRELYPSAWSFEDGLGYMMTVETYRDTPKECTGLAPYQNTLRQSFGLLAAFGESLLLDPDVDGDPTKIVPLGVKNHGLLNDFVRDQNWQGTVIGDRTILTSRGGLPKVFDGRNLLVAGFKRWSGGLLTVRPGAGAISVSNNTPWYGVRIVYFSENNTLEHISPVHVIQLQQNNGGIDVLNIPPHYDPRITAIRMYRTLGQATRELAEAAPLFPDKDGSLPNLFTDLFTFANADVDLFPAPLNLNQTRMPTVAYTASHDGRLYMTGDILEPDAVYFSDPGNPERVDVIENKLILEEGTGDRTNGLVSAFGSVFVFKANSTWRIDNLGGNQHQVNRISGVGAITPESIVTLTMPETGRTVIAFWSQHGPYLFDGSSFQYIGRPIEEQDQIGEVTSGYAWLDANSVVALHDIRRRKILFLYKPKVASDGSRVTLSQRSEAVVFDYRDGGWEHVTGIQGRVALTASFTGSTRSSLVAANSFSHAELSYENSWHPLLGGENGTVYEWGRGEEDGADSTNGVSRLVTTVSSYDAGAGEITCAAIPTVMPQKLWVTVIQQNTNEWFARPIVAPRGSGSNVVKINANYDPNGLPFNPANGDTIIFFFVPAYVEFPWDEMDLPFFEKQVHNLITWHSSDTYLKVARDYDETTKTSWSLLSGGQNQRSRTTINKRAEALKLELVSFSLQAELDAFGYEVSKTQGATKAQ